MKKVLRLFAVRMTALLMTALLLASLVPAAFAAESDPLKPKDLSYEDGNIVLHKQAERVGPDEWEVTVQVDVGPITVEPRKLEVVLMMDTSTSMKSCAEEEAHKLNHEEHTDACYDDSGLVFVCTDAEHEHSRLAGSCYTKCTSTLNPTHYSGKSHKKSGTSCTKSGNSYYFLSCTKKEHTHDDDCYEGEKVLICGHRLEDHGNASTCYYYDENGNKTAYPSRLDVAKEAANQLIAGLPEGTSVTCMVYNSASNIKTVSAYDDSVGYSSGTNTYSAIVSVFNPSEVEATKGQSPKFSDDDAKKVFILLTDGETRNDATTLNEAMAELDKFKGDKENPGTVFVVGFNYTNEELAEMASDDGAYLYASNVDQLFESFDTMGKSITAMLEDPMGTSVSFDLEEIKNVRVNSGELTTSGDTIFWYPEDDEVTDSVIQYQYKVKLNNSASMTVGKHEQIALNNPTSFKYGVQDSNQEVHEMKSAAFPIPMATYSVSTLEQKYLYNGTAIGEPPAKETQILHESITAFDTDFQNPPLYIPVPGSEGDYYQYTGTTSYARGDETIGANAVKPEKPMEYVVTHNYKLVKATKLYNITYEYTGTVPDGVEVPAAQQAQQNDTIQVVSVPTVGGWTFSGWTVAEGGAVIENGIFTMPGNDVKLVGSWEQVKNSYQVRVNYFTSTDGGAYVQDNAAPVELVPLTETADASVTVDYTDDLTYGGNTYGSPALAEGSAGQLADGNTLTVAPADPTAQVTLNLYREVLNPYQAVVHYQDEEGNELQDDLVSDEILFGDDYDVSEAEAVGSITVGDVIYDFVSDDTDENDTAYSGVMPVDGVEIIRTYAERSKAKATVHYVDSEGNPLQDDLTSEEIYIGSEYDVSEAETVGSITVGDVIYDFVSDDTDENDTAYSGVMPVDGVEITRTYAERSKAKATVHYVDSEGNPLQDDLTSEEIYIGSEYDVSEAEAVGSITVGDVIYDFVSDDTDENDTAYSGVMPDDGVEITRTYAERSKAKATVHYVDSEGNTLQDDLTSETIYIGSEYNVSEAETVTSITVDGITYDFVSDDTEANGTAYTGTMPEDGVEITRIYAERGKAKATVHYVDSEGNTLQDDLISEEIYIGSEYDVSEAETVTSITVDGIIYDFVSDDTEANGTAYTGTMLDDGVEITRVYAERGKAKATVHYVDSEGNTLQDDLISEEIYIGSEYDVSEAETVTSITVDGITYDFVSESSTAYTGTMPEEGVEITRTYAERSKAKATVHYVDSEGNILQDDLISEEIYIGSEYDVSEAEAVTSITVDGITYDFISDDTEANGTAYTGTMLDDGVEITRTYAERSKATATVHYVDTNGTPLRADTTDEQYIGSMYDVSIAETILTITVDGVDYDFVSESSTAYIGTMPEGGVEIIRTYAERSKAKATVHYVDSEGNTLQDDLTSEEIYIGSEYDVSEAETVTSITVDGITYDFVSDDTEANGTAYTGTMPEGGVEIIRIYAERGKAKATVHYVDSEGNTLQDDLTSEEIYIGSEYDVSEAKVVTSITVDGITYDFVSDDTEANGTAYTGTMPEDGVEITRTYAERSKATATVHYVDSEGNPLQDDLTSEEIYIGSEYDVSEAEAVGSITVGDVIYDFVSDDTEANGTVYTGTMLDDGVEITRTYAERGKAKATVHYVDSEGNTLQDDLTSEAIYIGSEYDVSEAEAVGSITVGDVIYDFVSDDTEANGTAYTGTMLDDGVEITRTYAERGKAKATVHYVDSEGNTLQDDLTSEEIYIGSEYDVSEAETVTSITVDGIIYDFVSDDTEANGTVYTGTMPEEGVEITRTYAERSKAKATVHYVDSEGNTLQDDLTSEEIYIGSEYDVSEAEAVTSITVDGITYDFVSESSTAYTGTMPEEGVEIIRTYAERSKATATVHYVDSEGNTLQDDLTSEAIYIGSEYDVSEAETVTSITVDGITYDFVSDDTEANSTAYTGTMPEEGVEITRTYAERSKATATVHYVDTNGTPLRADTTDEQYIGSMYDVSIAETILTITVDGVDYDFVSENSTAYTGTMPEDGVEITRTYAERSKATATVHYVDTNGTPLRADTTDEQYIGSMYDVSIAETILTITVDGVDYDFVSESSTAYTGTMPEDGVEITRTYAERSKAKATVHYVDSEGNTLQDDLISEEIYIGSEYDVSEAETVTSITVDGITYDFVSDDTATNGTAYTGIMPEGGVEIIRTYAERGKAIAVVRFVDENGNILMDDMQSDEIYINSEYDLTAAEEILSISKDGSEYVFEYDYHDTLQARAVVNNRDEDVSYRSAIPADGVMIIRVYKQVEVTYYYQVKYCFSVYDPDGNLTYSGMEQEDVTASDMQMVTISAPETRLHQERTFLRNGDAEQTADLTGSTEDRPYVFVVNYELHEERVPVQEEVVSTLPPQTGDDGAGLWLVLMLLSAGGMVLLIAKERRQRN